MAQHSKNLLNSKEIVYISLEDLLVIHADQVERYGGSHGIREIRLIESALFRPQSSFGGEDLYPTILEKVAVLAYSLLPNHAFVDTNKRTAMATLLAFLELNNCPLVCSQQQLIDAAIAIEDKTWEKEEIAQWLKNHTKPAR